MIKSFLALLILGLAACGKTPASDGKTVIRYLAKTGRLRMARFDAQAQVLRDMLPLPPE